jgi:outer membrane protein OmpU
MKHEGKTMKKVLFATTALVAFAGAAAADVTITGGAEMGIAGGDNVETTFFQSVDVRFSMSGTADNGLSFGAVIDLDDLVDTGADPVDVAGNFADFTVFISGDFGRLTMGDTDGAFDWALQEVNIGSPGSIGDNETGHAGYNGNGGFDGAGAFDGQVLRYDYSIGDIGFAISAETDDNAAIDYLFGIGLSYGFDFGGGSAGIGIGYQSSDDAAIAAGNQGFSATGVSFHVDLDSGLAAAVNYTAISDDGLFGGDGEHIAVGASYSFDAITVHANWGEYDWDATATVVDASGWGLAASYDFGGGLTAHIGYGNSDIGAVNLAAAPLPVDNSTWSFGLAMSF